MAPKCTEGKRKRLLLLARHMIEASRCAAQSVELTSNGTREMPKIQVDAEPPGLSLRSLSRFHALDKLCDLIVNFLDLQ